jgi:hypothetical protein
MGIGDNNKNCEKERGPLMNARVYMLLDILEDKYTYALQILQNLTGVVIADTLEGHPNTLVMVEAPDRQRLVELIMPVLGSVDRVTADLHLLVNREDRLAPRFVDSVGMKSYEKQAVYSNS